MDDCLAQCAIDFSGRPWLVWDATFKREKVGDMPTEMFLHFFKSFSDASKSNLNIKDLFEKDKERIEGDELKALKHIAQRAFDGTFFEISEVGESIESRTIDSLLHKRLIIKSGTNYNIYWDIFRDYLVTNIIPPIGESYLFRQGVNLCLEVFLLFKDSIGEETLESLLQKHSKNIGATHKFGPRNY